MAVAGAGSSLHRVREEGQVIDVWQELGMEEMFDDSFEGTVGVRGWAVMGTVTVTAQGHRSGVDANVWHQVTASAGSLQWGIVSHPEVSSRGLGHFRRRPAR